MTITAPQTLVIYGVPFLGTNNKRPENVEALQKLIDRYWNVMKESWNIPCHQQSEFAMLYKPRIFLKEEVFGVVVGAIGGSAGFYERIPTHTSIQISSFDSYPRATGIDALRLFDSWRVAVLGSTRVDGKDFYFPIIHETSPTLFLVSGATPVS